MDKGLVIALSLGFAIFMVGLAAMIGWIPEDYYFIGFFGTILAAVILLISGSSLKGKARWNNFFLASLMAFGFSVLYIYSLGFILAPICILLMVLSARKLASLG